MDKLNCREYLEKNSFIVEPDGTMRKCTPKEIDDTINFMQNKMGSGYIFVGNLMADTERDLFVDFAAAGVGPSGGMMPEFDYT